MKKPINNLEYLTHCPVCRKEYERFSLTVLERGEKKATLHLDCVHCQAASIIFVIANQNGIVSLGMITDVTREEAKKLINQESISRDEVIGIHEALKNINHVGEII